MAPPLETVTSAVAAAAALAAGTAAVNSELVTKVVVSGVPFQFTTAPEAKPVPYTVNVNAAEPGVFCSGASGALSSGTALCAGANDALRNRTNIAAAIVKLDPLLKRRGTVASPRN